MAEQTLFDCVESVKEEWRAVAGYEELYAVSSLGRVRSFYHDDRLLKTRLDRKLGGYPSLALWKDKKQKTHRVHILVAEAFLGPRAPGIEVNHKDLNKENNVVSNLEYVTPLENTRHARANGRMGGRLGRRLNAGKLSDTDRAEIASQHGKMSRRQLAEKYGVSTGTIEMTFRKAGCPPLGRNNFKRLNGTKNPKAKLNEDKVREIRKRFEAGETGEQLAKEFGVNFSNIGHVVSRRNWAWVKD